MCYFIKSEINLSKRVNFVESAVSYSLKLELKQCFVKYTILWSVTCNTGK